jgi:small subunit ribosomal protein S8
VELKYYQGQPVIKEISRGSKPSRRVYCGASAMPKVHNGLGIGIVSTSLGIFSDAEARKAGLGGEWICTVF